MPQIDWTQLLPWAKTVAIYVIWPLAYAFWKSESMALDNSTKANGWVHGYRLLKGLLAVVPPQAVKGAEDVVITSLPPAVSQVVTEMATIIAAPVAAPDQSIPITQPAPMAETQPGGTPQ